MRPARQRAALRFAVAVAVVAATSLALGTFDGHRATAQQPEGTGDGEAQVTQPPPSPDTADGDATRGDAPVICDQPGPVLQPGCTREDVRSTLETRSLLGLDEQDEDFPLPAYDIGCDEGGAFSFMRKLWCAAQSFPFAVGKWAVGIGIDVLRWALEFRVATALVPLAETMSRAYDASLVAGLQLRHVAWTIALAVAGWHLLRFRLVASLRELATTILVAAVGTFVITNPGGYLQGSVDLAQNSSGAVVEAVNDVMSTQAGGAANAQEVRDQLAATLRRSFVKEPYDQINWGHALDGRCAEMRDALLANGPHGSDDTPRDAMRAVGCTDEADFNAEPSDNRFVGALAMMAAAGLASVLLVVIALGTFAAQLTLVFLWSTTSLVWTIGLFPGGRVLLWRWLGRLAWSVLVTIAALFVVSWVALAVTAVLNVTANLSMLQRLLVVVVIVLVAYKLRGSINQGVSGITQRLSNRLQRITPNESDTGLPAAAAGAGAFTVGTAADAAVRQTAAEVPGGTLFLRRQEYKFRYRYIRGRGGPPYGPGTPAPAGGGGRSGGIPPTAPGNGPDGPAPGGDPAGGGGRRGGGPPAPGAGARVQAAIARSPLRYIPGHRLLAGAAGGAVGSAASAAKTARAVAMAPVLAPQAYVDAHRRVTGRSAQARRRLAQARATGREYAYNLAHPATVMRAANQQATAQAQTVRSGPRQAPSQRRQPVDVPATKPVQRRSTPRPQDRPAPTRDEQLALDLPPRTRQLRFDLGPIPEAPRQPPTATERSQRRPGDQRRSQNRLPASRSEQLAFDLPEQLRFDLGHVPVAPREPPPSATERPQPRRHTPPERGSRRQRSRPRRREET